MPWWLKDDGDTEGPLGFPMPDAEAKALDRLLADNPHAEYEQLVFEKATSAALTPGGRADVSWIMTEQRDRARDVVLLSGSATNCIATTPSSRSTTTTRSNRWARASGAARCARATSGA